MPIHVRINARASHDVDALMSKSIHVQMTHAVHMYIIVRVWIWHYIYMCVWVCVCVLLCACVYIYMYNMCVCACMIIIHIHIYVCVCACSCMFICVYILPANDLVRCGHTLENHTPMSWANIPLVVWVPYSYVITTNHRKHVIFKQVLQGYKALGNSGQFLSHDNCSYFAWKKWLADWLLHCRTRWHVYLVFFFHSIVLKHYYTLLQLKQI